MLNIEIEMLAISRDIVIARAYDTTVGNRGVIAIRRGEGIIWWNKTLPFVSFQPHMVRTTESTAYLVGGTYVDGRQIDNPRLSALDLASGEFTKLIDLGAVAVTGMTVSDDKIVYMTVYDDQHFDGSGRNRGTRLLKIQ